MKTDPLRWNQFSYLLEKKGGMYNSVNDPEMFILEIELRVSVV